MERGNDYYGGATSVNILVNLDTFNYTKVLLYNILYKTIYYGRDPVCFICYCQSCFPFLVRAKKVRQTFKLSFVYSDFDV